MKKKPRSPGWRIYKDVGRYFREMRRLRATPGLRECLAESVLSYSPQASQAALVVSRGHPGSQALMGRF